MKKTTKIITLLLALFILCSAFASCANKNGNEESTTVDKAQGENTNSEDTAEVEEKPDVEKKNYGKEFSILAMADMFKEDYFYAKENTGNDMTYEIYQRQINLKDYLGVDIRYTSYDDFLTYTDGFKTSVTAKDGSYNLILTHVYYGVSDLVSGNYLCSFDDFDSINLDADYWNKSVMDDVEYRGEHYLGYSDFNLAYVYLIAFNKRIYNDISHNLDKSLYDLVNDREWTLDKMLEISKLYGGDADGDGQITENDNFGMVGLMWVPMCSFLQSSNLNIIAKGSSGDYQLTINTPKTVELIEKLREFVAADYTWLYFHTASEEEQIGLKTDRALFALLQSYQLIELKDTAVKFGVLPYPMYNLSQKDVGYRTLSWNGFMGIANDVKDKNMVGDTLEMLSYYSKPVTTVFYERLLGAKVAEAPEDAAMLKLIWASQVSDPGLTYSFFDGSLDTLLYAIPRCINENKQFASYYKGASRAAIKAVNKYLNGTK